MPTSKQISILMLDLPLPGIFNWEYKTKYFRFSHFKVDSHKELKSQDQRKKLRDRVAWTPVVEIRGKIHCVPTHTNGMDLFCSLAVELWHMACTLVACIERKRFYFLSFFCLLKGDSRD